MGKEDTMVDLGDLLDPGSYNPLGGLERFVTSTVTQMRQPLPTKNTAMPDQKQEEVKEVLELMKLLLDTLFV